MNRRQLLKLTGAGALALAAPSGVLAKGVQTYRGKHGKIIFTPDTGDGFLLEVSGIRYTGKIDKGTLNRLKTGAGDGDHSISIDRSQQKYSIDRGKAIIDFDNGKGPVIEPIPDHIGPIGVVILIIIIIHGKWPPKPGKRVQIAVNGSRLELNPV